MSLFTPSRRWQAPFLPFRKERLQMRMLARLERMVKGPLWGCRMCGNCLLQETAFICPMECPKGLRNGPCGGSSEKSCYVDSTRKCIWFAIFEKSFKMNRQDRLLEVLPPVDWTKAGTETWADVYHQLRKTGTWRFVKSRFASDMSDRKMVWEDVFRPVRQPGWWNGDSEYHPPAYTEPVSLLESRLKKKEFVFTTELLPPLHAGTDRLRKNIGLVKDYVTAVNFTDNSSAIPRMSGLVCSAHAASAGAEPVYQITARDNSRYGFQSKVLGANSMGVNNILCITGDSPVAGIPPAASMDIFDLDSVQMIWILRKMRDEGIFLDGREIKQRPRIFIGAAASPVTSRPEFQAIREEKKVNAGAQFLQTNLVFEKEGVERWLEQLDRRNVLDKVFILIGVAPIRSIGMAEKLNSVPGVHIPPSLVERIRKAGSSAEEEGISISLEFIDSIRRLKGVSGIHLMTLGCESAVERIVKESGLQSEK